MLGIEDSYKKEKETMAWEGIAGQRPHREGMSTE